MRSLQLMLKVFIAASLLVQPIGSFASASKSSHTHKTKSHSSRKTSKKNIPRAPANVWERIRFGMQIPYFTLQFTPTSASTPTSTKSLLANSSKLQKNSLIKTTLLPVHHDENRIKLTATESVNNATTKQRLSASLIQKQIVDYANNNSPEPLVHTRIRTRLEFHPRTDKQPTAIAPLIEKTVTTVPVPVATEAKSPLESEQVQAQVLPKENDPEKEQRIAKQAQVNERINKQIAWYSQNRGYLQRVAERARPYLYHIVSELSSNHLPAELALLPIVESAYQPMAQSPKSAAGLWQFIPSTGLDFDLAQSERYDGRLDIDASTRAAARYLGFLKRHFNGDWLLALAAYNCGLGRVDDAINSNQANGLATDYWSLQLPEETQDYVPRFLALASIFAHPANYGIKLPAVKNEPYFVKVKVERQFDIDYLSKKQLSTIAELANLSYEQFIQLNPAYLKPTPETNEPFTLLMPATNAKKLHQHLDYVELFLAESSAVKTPEQKSTRPDVQKNLPTTIMTALPTKLPEFTSPLLSINLNANQTTPRISNQFVFIKS